MVEIQYVSDLHLEHTANSLWLRQHPLVAKGQIMVMAGDVTVLGDAEQARHPLLDWCASHFELTLIVPGNHEFYGGVDVEQALQGMDVELRPGVRCVCNRAVSFHGVELLPTTLWTPIAEADRPAAARDMVDYTRITYRGRRMTPDDSDEIHNRCLQWLQNALAKEPCGRRVVVTHHCPIDSEDPRYAANGLSSAFIVPMPKFVERSGAQAWLFGHTHYNAARGLQLGNTTLHTNQLGYAKHGPCQGFDPAATFTA